MCALASNSNKNWLPLPLPLLLLTIAQISSQHAIAGSVEYLPGFEGPLPFQLETGYVGVDGEDVQVFYYFVKSESNPKEDPLILWITGGPGCSSFTGLAYEIGPLMFKMVESNGSLPTMLYNPNSWTKMTSIIFVDLPVRTGFTYTKTHHTSNPTDTQFCDHTCEFIRNWLLNHPEFISNPFYLGGDSYSGIPIPIIAQNISDVNEAGVEQFINLKGYILGNPITFPSEGEGNYAIQFAHGMGLIPDEIYESLKMSCRGEYRKQFIDPNNIHCLQYLEAYHECINGLDTAQILEPNCGYASPRPRKSMRKRRALDERVNELYIAKQSLSTFRCRMNGYRLAYSWADDKSVRDALHIRKGTIGKWKRCSLVALKTTNSDVRSFHLNLSKKGYRSLIYSGDHDMIVPHQSTQAWINDLNYSIVDQWRSWRVNGQIAGYTRTYSNNMTFATVKGGGHTAPEYRPEECFGMFQRWISHQPL